MCRCWWDRLVIRRIEDREVCTGDEEGSVREKIKKRELRDIPYRRMKM